MKQTLFYVIFITILVVLLNCSISFANILFTIHKLDSSAFEQDDGYVYYSLQHESDPLEQEIESFRKVSQLLNEQDVFSYYELYTQPLKAVAGRGPFIDSTTMQFSDQCDWTPCIQINQSIQDNFSLSLFNGRLFQKEDFIYDGIKKIPVLLGYSYRDVYEIGDTFQGNYLFDLYTYEIIGFLSEGSKISTSIKKVVLDDFIILPSFDLKNGTPVTNGLKIHYANKTSGFIKTNMDIIKLQGIPLYLF